MIYECAECGRALPSGVAACPICGEKFTEPVPADAEMPRHGFTTVGTSKAIIFGPPASAGEVEGEQK